jgi:uncharacterized protein YjlB
MSSNLTSEKGTTREEERPVRTGSGDGEDDMATKNGTSSQAEDNGQAPLGPGRTVHHLLGDDGIFPNSRFPLIVYPGALDLPDKDPASGFESLFESNQWGRSWRNGVYDFHHYHSTAHEVLGCYGGSARVQLGGEKGIIVEVCAGDVVIIPAGVAHKNLGSSRDFRVVGAYPLGQDPDMNYGKPEERPRTDRSIAAVPLPEADPVHGVKGPLFSFWKGKMLRK